MGVPNYATVNGSLIGESGQIGTVFYHPDALGSVTMTSDPSGNVLNEYRYNPYGSQLSKSGSAPDPRFLWVGCEGYRQTHDLYSDVYIRARHYDSTSGTWTSVDPLWPDQLPYNYVDMSPCQVFHTKT